MSDGDARKRTLSRFASDQLLRIDLPVDGRPQPASLKRLIAVLGLVKAKETLHEDDWVVLVADDSTLDLRQASELLQQFVHLRRFLLIWCGAKTSDAAGADAPPAPDAVEGPRPGPFDHEGLVAVLRRLKAQSAAAVLDLQLHQAFLSGALTSGAFAGTEIASARLATAVADSAPSVTTLDSRSSATADALLQLATDDRRIVVVALDTQLALTTLAVLHADRYFEIPIADADALAWCADWRPAAAAP